MANPILITLGLSIALIVATALLGRNRKGLGACALFAALCLFVIGPFSFLLLSFSAVALLILLLATAVGTPRYLATGK